MKVRVSDELVAQFAERLRAGGPLGKLFPGRMAECEFTDQQREVIRQARVEQKARIRKSKAGSEAEPNPRGESLLRTVEKPGARALAGGARPLSRLRKLLYLQSGRCFFCHRPLRAEDASIEHLNPKANGGTNAEANLVVCHATLNQTFGAMDLKRKFEFVLKAQGSFVCPGWESD